jgi:hypothetical protein
VERRQENYLYNEFGIAPHQGVSLKEYPGATVCEELDITKRVWNVNPYIKLVNPYIKMEAAWRDLR